MIDLSGTCPQCKGTNISPCSPILINNFYCNDCKVYLVLKSEVTKTKVYLLCRISIHHPFMKVFKTKALAEEYLKSLPIMDKWDFISEIVEHELEE